MVTWTIFKNHLLEVGLPQIRETMALRTLTTVDLFHFYRVWGHRCMNKNSLRYHLVEDPVTYDFTLHLRAHDHTTWVWRCLGTASFGHFLLGSHNFHCGHGSWLACEVARTAMCFISLREEEEVGAVRTVYKLPHIYLTYVRENRWLVADEPVEVRDLRKFTDHFRWIYRIYLEWMKEAKQEDVNM